MKFKRRNIDADTHDPVVQYSLLGWETEPKIGATARAIYIEGYWPHFHRWEEVQDFMMRLRIAWEAHEHIGKSRSPVLLQEIADGGEFPLPTEPELLDRAVQTLERQWAKSHNETTKTEVKVEPPKEVAKADASN